MKILITTDLYLPTLNGVVTSILNLKQELIKRGHEVRVLTLQQDQQVEEEPDTYYIKSISAGKVYPQARIMRSIGNKQLKDIVSWKPEIIHSQCEFSTYFLAKIIAKRVNAPIVHTYHTVYEDYTHYFSKSEIVGYNVVKLFSKIILNQTQIVIAPTDKVKILLCNYKISKPIYTVPTGIDLKKYFVQVPISTILDKKEQLGIPAENLVLIYLGRLAKEKNLNELIEFMDNLEIDKISLLIVGDGPERYALEKYAHSISNFKNIIFTGRVNRDDVNEYYQMADIFVSASTSETQGLTYIEALANGVPLLCRKDDCLNEVLYNYENGFQYSTFIEFKEFIKYFIEHKELKIKYKKCSREVAQRYSKEKFAESVEKIYGLSILYKNNLSYL
ncbi:glycosyltransferase [[Clostridium] fimetarium]|uniref:1,2-diacylglycerol 3-alpha-glucosyltransferase n=1 Tax=[Clostridium] fimetarium TaxID=99656 RepID=A0A1I0Q7L5_9FIRM|nr:glycosyltransferase [[Clostridium] fimetarium]SEW22974.1 1,2-diacylglycerol 3-alpha-glucosyltransferase [[Clostridium] fimetarium]